MSSPSLHSLADLGWNAWFASHRVTSSTTFPARVAAEHRGGYQLVSEDGTYRATLTGSLRRGNRDPLDLPAVGDWVLARRGEGDRAAIERVLPRLTQLVRQSSGTRADAQVVATNVDLVVVVMALDLDFNPRRLERWAAVIESSGALPCVVLNKSDLCDDPEPHVVQAAACLPGAQVIVASATSRAGLDGLRAAIRPGVTAALVGASGVGKSSLVNALIGTQVQATLEVREHDHRGRHATTHRELFVLPGGGLLVDTPGLRELAAWGDGPAPSTFDELDQLATQCRFRNCGHRDEPGCAVLAALHDGSLDEAKLRAWQKLEKERAFQARKQDSVAAHAERLRWKAITKAIRAREELEGR